MKFAFKFFFLLFLVLTTSEVLASPANIKKISSQTMDNAVRMEIVLDQSVKYHSFFLTSPDRFVIDLDNTHATSIPLPDFAESPWISQLRIAPHTTETQRIVFQLTQPVVDRIVLLHPDQTQSWHLIIDLKLKDKKKSSFVSEINSTVKKDVVKIFDDIDHPTTEKSSSVMKTALGHATHCITVVIDPGHGGHDPGAIGKHGTKEKNVTLAISKYLNDYINQTPGMCAYMTRTTDDFVSLRGRLSIARKKSADLFIAIHADNFRNSTARGATVFALSQHGATNEAARWIAHNENVSDLLEIGDVENKDKDLQSVLMDISQNETINRSLILGKDILINLDDVSKLHHTIVEQAGFVVLKAPDIPSVLVETGFLSNNYEENLLAQSSYQKKIALAIYRGIMEYSKQYASPKGKTSASKT